MDEDGWDAVKPYIDAQGINYPVMVGNDGVAQLYGATSLPATFIIDKSGRIASTHVGLVIIRMNTKPTFEQCSTNDKREQRRGMKLTLHPEE